MCKICQLFGANLNLVAGPAIPVHASPVFHEIFRGSARGTIAVRPTFYVEIALGNISRACLNVLTAMLFWERLSQQAAGCKNISYSTACGEGLAAKAWGNKNILWSGPGREKLKSNASGAKNIYTAPFAYEALNALAEAIKQATGTAVFEIALPPGSELRVDSGTFRVTLDGENILSAQAGAWINLTRELLYLDIESATGGKLQGTMIYTERYL